MRTQVDKQEVCQIFFATFRQMLVFASGKRTIIAALNHFVYTNEFIFVDANLYFPANLQKRPFQRGAHMQERDIGSVIGTLGGQEQGPSASLAKRPALEPPNVSDLSGAGFLQVSRAEHVPVKKQVSLRIDEDILEFFKQQGSRYQTKMHAVLRTYVDEKILQRRK